MMNSKEIITQGSLDQRGIDVSAWSALKNSIYPGAKDESIIMAVDYCRARQLDPLMKPVHLVPMLVTDAKNADSKQWRDVVMPGVGLYRIQADRSGNYAGSSEPQFGPIIEGKFSNNVLVRYPEWCRYSVFKLMSDGKIVEFISKEFWLENYATAGKNTDAPNHMWKKRPFAQLAKCCEAQALRKAWPEIGQQPTAEEMEGKMFDVIGEQEINNRNISGITTQSTGATAMNNLINGKAEVSQSNSDSRSSDDLLAAFTSKMSKATSIDELHLFFNGGEWPDGKKRQGARQIFSGEDLIKAEDIYKIRLDEMNQVPA